MNIIKIIGVVLSISLLAPLLGSADISANPVVMTNSCLFETQLRNALSSLNEKYKEIEKRSPAAGYQVVIETTPQIKADLLPQSGARTQKYLVGLPENEEAYKNECPFCAIQVDLKSRRIFRQFKENFAIISNSGQILVIPKEHYAHWFVTPLEVQLQLILDAVALRKEFPESESQPIVLHCGAAAGQTVFHVHVRTNIYP